MNDPVVLHLMIYLLFYIYAKYSKTESFFIDIALDSI